MSAPAPIREPGVQPGIISRVADRLMALPSSSRYGIAVGAAALGVVLRLALDPLLGTRMPYITLVPFILLSASIGGLWPGVVTTVLCAVAMGFWIEPAYSWVVADKTDLIGLLAFVGVGAVVSGLSEAWRGRTVAAFYSEKGLRNARQEADRAAEHLRVALEAGRMGTWDYTLSTGAVKWSPGLEAIHGYSPGTFPGTFEAFRNEIHPEDRQRLLEAIQAAVDQRRVHQVEYRIVRVDGMVRWVEGRGRLFTDANGTPERMVGVCADVTERKHAEEKFRLAVEAAPSAMLMIDRHGTIQMINALAEGLFGYSRGEIVGRPIEQLVPTRFRGGHAASRTQFFGDPRQRPMGVGRELFALRKDGTEVAVEIGLSPLETEDGSFVLAAVTDITERKRAEDALRTREAELDLITSHTPLLLIRCSRDLRYVFVNRACAAFFGRPEADIIGKAIPEVMGDAAFGAISPYIERVLRGEDVDFEIEIPYAHAGQRFMRALYTPDRDERGKIIGWIATVTDVTERRLAENELKRIAALLEAANTAERAAKREAEHANQLKDQFLATVSHELRAPLNAVLGWAEMLRLGILDDARRQRALDAVCVNAKRQSQLIDDLLDVSRIVSGNMRINRSAVDLQAAIRAALDVVQPSAEAKGIRLETDIDPSIGTVFGDPTRLQQVLWNLLANGVKFTPERGTVCVKVQRAENAVEIVVTDTGKGIAPNFLPHVFEAFQQADSTTTRTHGGLGLGLAIVKYLIEAHGGTVTANSDGEGQGATFTVQLPIVAVYAEEVVTASPALAAESLSLVGAPPSLAGISVLVVDDDRDSRDLVCALLESAGAAVLAAASGDEALRTLQREHVDVLLADIAMPGSDGYSLIRKVRALESPFKAAIPAAALTSFTGDDDRQHASQSGFQLHLGKPIESRVLVQAVASLASRITM